MELKFKTKRKKIYPKINYENYILQDVHVKRNKNENMQDFFQKLTCSWMLLAMPMGVVGCFMTEQRVQIWFWILAYMLMSFFFICLFSKKMRTWQLHISALVIFIAVIINPLGIYRGLLNFVNQCLNLWNERFNTYIMLFDVRSCTLMNRIQFFVVLTVLIVYLAFLCVRKEEIIAATMGLLLMILVINLFGLQVRTFFVAVSILGWLSIWAMDALVYQNYLGNVVFGLLVLAALVIILRATADYTASPAVSRFQTAFLNAVETFRYGEDSLPQGDLVKACDMVGSEEDKTLHITVKTAEKTYLRGYVGGVFDGTKWKSPDKGSYYGDNNGILQWMQDQGLSMPFQYAVYENSNVASDETQTEVSVTNVGANRKYVYLPYTVSQLQSGNGKIAYDWQVISGNFFGSKSYDYTSLAGSGDADSLTHHDLKDTAAAKSYETAESVYRNFVYENNIGISEDEKAYIEKVFFNNVSQTSSSLSQITQQIRLVLREYSSYSDQPQPYDGRKDFVSWFIEDAKTSNSAYYATVAVLAYRTAGIPARYVEGYYLSAYDASQHNDADETTFDISRKNAHAWVEVYVDGIGWMPMEVVPGFYYASYTLSQMLDTPQSSVNIQDQNPENQLNGSTADALENHYNNQTTAQAIVKKTAYAMGIFILLCFLAWICRTVIILQYQWRRRKWQKRLDSAEDADYCRMAYQNVCMLLKQDKQSVVEDFPFENESIFEDHYENLSALEYHHFIELIEKTIFGDIALEVNEKVIIKNFIENLGKNVAQNADLWRKFRIKYLLVLL